MTERRVATAAGGVALILAGLACNAPIGDQQAEPGALETALAGTLSAVSTQTQAAAPSPTSTHTPRPSPTPTQTPTATPPPPSARLTANTNCRTGPLAVYDLIVTFLSGQEVHILGKTAQEDYWYVADPASPETQCWMWGRYAQLSGDVAQVPVFTPPPSPTPSYLWAGTWSVQIDGDTGSMTLSQSGSSISGSLSGEGETFDIAGSTTDGGRVVNGQALLEGTPEVNFTWYMLDNKDQFRGSFIRVSPDVGEGTWCGARHGMGFPSPCLWP